jgi:hypothetical protein
MDSNLLTEEKSAGRERQAGDGGRRDWFLFRPPLLDGLTDWIELRMLINLAYKASHRSFCFDLSLNLS